MSMVVCARHGNGNGCTVCPHVLNAVLTGARCDGIEYLEHVAADDPDLRLAAWFCPQCVAEYQLPASGTAVANPDEFLKRTGKLYRPICAGCFEDWQRRATPRTDVQGFLDPRQFPFVEELEARWEAIRDEYRALPTDAFDPWVQREMHGGGWTVFGLYALGRPIPGACSSCPLTAQALAQVPGVSMAGFSRLAPRTHVKPHVGWAASVYRLHLGLVVPQGCRLRVASETRTWHDGRSLLFDDTVEHEAWNDSDLMRGVLLVDFLRPGVGGLAEDHVPEEVQRYAESLGRAAQRRAH
jgi:hypothetical protein